ncbi:ABC transporter ATP-binding protein [Halomonas aquatica]|uniref:ABC transporter ATP-binding protein n=1 Tax=Halomonas aquatica TaxID=3151123 RepID=A0ABV1NAR9_9GAMM
MSTSDVLLSCEGVTRRFGGLVALDQLDLEVKRGDILGFLGPNGSGKTTFFNVLTGIYDFSDGQAHFAGENISKHSAQAVYRAGIARTFQRSRMCLSLSLFDNIMVGNHKHLNLGLGFNLFRRGAFARDYEQRYEQARELVRVFSPNLADRMSEAVGGFPMLDRRRIEICRALISQPKLLLLDEPSAGMTHEETHQLMGDILSVREHTPELSIIIIEHEMSVMERITDHCAVLNFGKKICEGTYQDVVNNPQVREAYLGIE